MRRPALITEIADLKKRVAIKKGQMEWIEKSTNWQSEQYNSTQFEMFNLIQLLDSHMDEYYYVAKNELLALDAELDKLQDCLMADPINMDQLVISQKETKSKRMELWKEMQSVLWIEEASTSAKAMVDKGVEGFSINTKREGDRIVDWDVVKDAKPLSEMAKTEAVRKEAHNG